MPVVYASKAIIPAPKVSFVKDYQTSDDGTVIGTVWSIQVKGELVSWKGSPNSLGVFWTASDYPPDEVWDANTGLASIERKQEALRGLFATQGQTLEWQPLDGSAPIRCNPRVKRISFPEGGWFQTCEYLIELEADVLYGLHGGEDAGDVTTYKVSKGTEEWTVETVDEKLRTYRLSHTLSATGKRFYDSTGTLTQAAWTNARDFVLNRIGLGLKVDRMNAPGVLDATLGAFNYLRNQTVGELSGNFSVSETWLCYDPQGGPPAYEESDVSTKFTLNDNRTTVTAQGTVTGLEVRDTSTRALVSTRYANALAKWNLIQPSLLTRASAAAGVTLNPSLVAKTVGTNQTSGTITYALEYDTRPAPTTAGALSEVVTITGDNPADVFATFPVPGEASGPIYQAMNTVTGKHRTVQVDIQMPPKSYAFNPTMPNVLPLILANKPVGVQVFVDHDSETWVDVQGRYSRTVGFVWK